MKLLAVILIFSLKVVAFEEGVTFHCTDEAQREFSFDYRYDDEKIRVKEERTSRGLEKTISWFHPYCSVGYTYIESSGLENMFVSGGVNCEGEPSRHDCFITPILRDHLIQAAAACCSWGTEEKPIPGCMKGC